MSRSRKLPKLLQTQKPPQSPGLKETNFFFPLVPIIHFVVEIVVALFLFCVIGLAAIFFSVIIEWLESMNLNGTFASVLRVLEIVVLFVDAGLFLMFVFKSGYVTGRRLWKQ
jgi:uncharacterized membrane protein YqhA